MKRNTPLARRKARLSAVSAKRAASIDELDAQRPLIAARSRGICERCGWHRAVHVHHKLRRSQGGTHDLSNLAALCHGCHQAVHDHPEQSYRDGWLIKGGER